MSRRQSLILTVFFIVFLSVPIVAHIAGIRPGEIENRRLSDRPELTLGHALDEDYYAGWTGYLNDTFPLRTAAIRTNLRIEQAVFGSSSAEVFQGEQGWLYLERSFTKPCDAALTSAAAATAFAEFVDQIEAPTASVVAPSKFRIAPEFLGDDGESASACALEAGEKLSAALVDNDIEGYRDLWSAIGELGPGEDLYYRTDTHWRDNAAMEMIEQVATELDLDFHERYVKSRGNTGKVGDLTRLQGTPATEDAERLVVRRPGVKVARLKGQEPSPHVTRFDATASGKAGLASGETLVIHDSYFEPGTRHLMYSFAQFSEETTYVHLDGLDSIDLVEMIGSADRVVIEVAERLFAGRMQELVDAGMVTAPAG